MSIIPFARRKLIRPGANDPRIKARLGILHVDGGNAESLHDWFNGPSGGIESHGHVRLGGVLEQYRDTGWEADANFLANPFALSFESQGFGAGKWSDEQLDTIKRIIRWCHREHHIPLQVAGRWDGEGWGYHTMFEEWSNVPGKICPGPQRKEQFHDIIAPWMRRGGVIKEEALTPNITAALQADDLDTRVRALKHVIRRGSDEASAAAKGWLTSIRAVQEARADMRTFRGDLRGLQVKA